MTLPDLLTNTSVLPRSYKAEPEARIKVLVFYLGGESEEKGK